MCSFNIDFSKIFLGAMPQTPYWGGATPLLPRSHPPWRSGASRLAAPPRLAWDLQSLHHRVPPLIKMLATRLLPALGLLPRISRSPR